MRAHMVSASLALLVCTATAAHPQVSVGDITVTILYDNTVLTPGTTAEWGFSCFIQCAGDTILFDGGTYGNILLANAETLGVDLSDTRKGFLSHDHLDHAGGLSSALAKAPGVPVYVGALFSPSVIQAITQSGGRPVLVTGPVEISGNLHSSGELFSSIGAYEQSLVMDTDSGVVVVVGCAHPGIVQMLRRVKEGLGREIFAVFGGFHLLDLSREQVEAIVQEFRSLGVRKCGPTHCTGDLAIQLIAQAYGSDFLPMGVGRVIHFSASGVSAASPVMWVSPAAINFGHAELGGRQDTLTLTLENITPRPLKVSEISHTNPAFELLDIPQLPATIQAGTPMKVRTVFHPSASEPYGDTVRVVSDDAMSPVRLIPVLGEGFVVTRASENTLYALGGLAGHGNLRTVDPATGATHLVGPSGCVQIWGARVSPLTGEIIALAPVGFSTQVVRLSAAGDHFVTVATFTSSGWKGMAFRGDTLYLTRYYGIYRWDMKAPAATLLKVFSSQYQFSGLAYRSAKDDFLATVGTSSAAADFLYRIDPSTWTITSVGAPGMKPVQDVVFDDAQTFFGVLTPGTGESALLRIDPETGAATTIGPTGAGGIMTLAGRGVLTEVGMTEPLPAGFWLSQNYPNPFNRTTEIASQVAPPGQGPSGNAGMKDTWVELKVFDVLACLVATLVEEPRAPGRHTVRFDASTLTSGMYFCLLRAGGCAATKKLLVVR